MTPSPSAARSLTFRKLLTLQNFTAYKLQIEGVIDGRVQAVPRAVMAAGAIMRGSRGGIDLPKSDIGRVKSHLVKCYAKMNDTPPWQDG